MGENCTIIRMLVEDNIYGCVVTHGFAVFNHWHNEMEFIYVEEGKLDIDVDGNVYGVKEGQIIIVSSNVMHAYLKTDPGTVIWVAKVFLKNILGCLDTKQRMTDIYRNTLIIKATDRMKIIFSDLIHAQYGKMNEFYSGIKVSELTIEILSNKNTIKQYIPTKMVENTENIYKMQQFIEENLYKDITLTMVADYLGFSPAYCSKYIKKNTNLNFLDYVNSVRLREAEELLQTTETCITEVAYSTGFKSIQCFNRIFKKHRGVTPSQYKKNFKNKKENRIGQKMSGMVA